jgi:hypothetical protein
MNSKVKPSVPAKAPGKIGSPRKSLAKSAPTADARWQRTQRYGWDKGGAQGGRKS